MPPLPPAPRRALLGLAVVAAAGIAGCTGRGGDGGVSGSTDEGTSRHAYRYGDADAQVADLWLPAGPVPSRTAVLVHGGFWKAGYDRSLEDRVAADLVGAGWAVWNVDYRGVGAGGGWPATLTDVAAGVDLLARAASEHGLALSRTAFVGHSAGGQLVLWAAGRGGLPDGAPGAVPAAASAVLPTAVVAQAGVDDLVLGDRLRLGDGAVAALLGGGPDEVPDRYAVADPARRVPLGVPVLAVVGERDDVVPLEVSRSFADAARAAGDDVRLEVVPGEDHSAHLDPSSACWRAARTWLDAQLPA